MMKQTFIFLVLLTLLGSYVLAETNPGVPPSAKEFWKPRPEDLEPAMTSKRLDLPEEMRASLQNLTLPQLIDIALRNSPRTRATWLRALAAEAGIGIERSEYYPQIDASLDLNRSVGSAGGQGFRFEQTRFGPSVILDYTLLDFGKRKADVEEARQNLISANWNHNAMIQTVVLDVQRAYYLYLNNRALLLSEEATVKEAQTNLDSAEERRRAGVATVSDVLQARTLLSQAQLNAETVRGQINTVRGILAVALGVPPDSPFDVAGEIPETLPLDQAGLQVENLIREAHARRPELAALRALARGAESNVRSVNAQRWPELGTRGSLDRTYYLDPLNGRNNYSVGLSFRVPMFTGFRQKYEEKEAEAIAAALKADVQNLQQQVGLQVWTSYTQINTASQRVRTAQDLVASARESYEVALGRYRAGVGNIQELLSAQAALESARAQQIESKTDWYLAMAELARNTGSLWMIGNTTVPGDK